MYHSFSACCPIFSRSPPPCSEFSVCCVPSSGAKLISVFCPHGWWGGLWTAGLSQERLTPIFQVGDNQVVTNETKHIYNSHACTGKHTLVSHTQSLCTHRQTHWSHTVLQATSRHRHRHSLPAWWRAAEQGPRREWKCNHVYCYKATLVAHHHRVQRSVAALTQLHVCTSWCRTHTVQCMCVWRCSHSCMRVYVCGAAATEFHVCVALQPQLHACVCVALQPQSSMCVWLHSQLHACVTTATEFHVCVAPQPVTCVCDYSHRVPYVCVAPQPATCVCVCGCSHSYLCVWLQPGELMRSLYLPPTSGCIVQSSIYNTLFIQRCAFTSRPAVLLVRNSGGWAAYPKTMCSLQSLSPNNPPPPSPPPPPPPPSLLEAEAIHL